MKPRSKILIIAGSDSSGGAGIQADIKTVTALGSYAMTAITAVTSQNTMGVKSIVAINPKEILNQIIFTSNDINPDAIKIGMLHSSKVIEIVIKSLDKIKVKKIILDPVMVAKGGAKLIDNKAIKLLKNELNGKKPLIGFIGSPWTVATYIVEGNSSKQFTNILGMLKSNPILLHKILNLLTDISIKYLSLMLLAFIILLVVNKFNIKKFLP